MSDGKPIKKVLLGDKTIAARWLPYARTVFEQTLKLGLYTRTVFVDPDNNVTIRVITQGIRSIYIQAEPVVRRFAGWPYDDNHPYGWGAPYDPNTNVILDKQNKVVFTYGTPESPSNKTATITVPPATTMYWNWPNNDRTEVLYGVTNWVNKTGKTVISWDGLPSRHATELHDQLQVKIGQQCKANGFWNYGKLGQYMTLGTMCESYPTVKNRYGGVRKITNGKYRWNNTANLYDDDLDTVLAFTNRIYKDGRLVHTVPGNYIVTGASIVIIDGAAYVSAVVADHDPDYGTQKEAYYLARLGSSEYVLKAFDFSYMYKSDGRIYPNNGYVSDEVIYMSPERNCSVWSFDSTGKRAAAIRDFCYIPKSGEEQSSATFSREILELNIIFDEKNNPEITITRSPGASSNTLTVDLEEPVGEDDILHRYNNGAATVLSVDFYNDQLVTLQSYVATVETYTPTAGSYDWFYSDAFEAAFFVKGTKLLYYPPDISMYFDSRARAEEKHYFAIYPKIIEFNEALDGEVFQEIFRSGGDIRTDKYSSGSTEVYPSAIGDDQPCWGRERRSPAVFADLYEVDLRKRFALYHLESHPYSYVMGYTGNSTVYPQDSKLRELSYAFPHHHYHTTYATIEGFTFQVSENEPAIDYYFRGVGDQMANASLNDWIEDEICCPEVFIQIGLLRGQPFKFGEACIPHFVKEPGMGQSYSSWIDYNDGLIYLCLCTDLNMPYSQRSINKVFVIHKERQEIVYSYSIGENMKIGDFYQGNDIDMLSYDTKIRYKNKFEANANIPYAPEGGFSNIGVI
jgi:hypothetical protein